VIVKTKFNNDIRRFTIANDTTFEQLRQLLKKLHPQDLADLDMKYTDDEGDNIKIATNEELEEAIRFSLTQIPPLLRLSFHSRAKLCVSTSSEKPNARKNNSIHSNLEEQPKNIAAKGMDNRRELKSQGEEQCQKKRASTSTSESKKEKGIQKTISQAASELASETRLKCQEICKQMAETNQEISQKMKEQCDSVCSATSTNCQTLADEICILTSSSHDSEMADRLDQLCKETSELVHNSVFRDASLGHESSSRSTSCDIDRLVDATVASCHSLSSSTTSSCINQASILVKKLLAL